jgi:hypothetical protein
MARGYVSSAVKDTSKLLKFTKFSIYVEDVLASYLQKSTLFSYVTLCSFGESATPIFRVVFKWKTARSSEKFVRVCLTMASHALRQNYLYWPQ